MYFCFCLIYVFLNIDVSTGTHDSPTTTPPPVSESGLPSHVFYQDPYGNTFYFHYGTGRYVNRNDDLTLSFSQQEALRTWQNSFDGMSGSPLSFAPPIQLTLIQQCQLLTYHRGLFTPRSTADASVCTLLLGPSGDSIRVGPSPSTRSGSGCLPEPEDCDTLEYICPSVISIATPSVAYTVEGVLVYIPQLDDLGYNQEFLENDCIYETCTWPPFVFFDEACVCCQTTRGENALVGGLDDPSVFAVAKIVIDKGNCVAKLQLTGGVESTTTMAD